MKWIVVLSILVIGIGIAIQSWIQQGQLAQLKRLKDSIRVPDVRILRDEWGVPHIFGEKDEDVAYGLAYAHCEDDFETMEGHFIASRAQMGLLLGKKGAAIDYFNHLTRVREKVDRQYYTSIDPKVRKILRSYANGVNHYAATHPDQVRMASIFPLTGKDVVAATTLILPLFFKMDRTIMKILNLPIPKPGEEHMGSNAFAVSPKRSANGETFFAINSHQPFEGPVSWYEVHLHSEEGWNIAGGVFPGSPVVLHGHTLTHGWAHTVNRPDILDVFELQMNPDNQNEYLIDREWKELEVRQAPIGVKLFGPFFWTFQREVLWSVFGPTLRAPSGKVYSMRFSGMDTINLMQQWYYMNKAKSFEQFKEALKLNAIPMFNVLYADNKGNIYYLYNAQLPIRNTSVGVDWQKDLPGNDSSLLWTEYLPFDNLPQVLNPSSGFVQNCNSSPFQTTIGEENPKSDDFSPSFGIEGDKMSNRAIMLLSLLENDTSITFEEFLNIKYNMQYSKNSRIAKYVEKVLSRTIPVPNDIKDEPLLEEAIQLLSKWDLGADPTNRHAALPIVAFVNYLQLDFAFAVSDPGEVLQCNIPAGDRMSARELKKFHGRLDVEWQNVNRHKRGTLDLPVGGGPDIVHCMIGQKTGDGKLKGFIGDSYILIVAWDKHGNLQHSKSIHQYGSATKNAQSPHYHDQAALFTQRKLKDVYFTEEQIRLLLEKEYRPGQELETL